VSARLRDATGEIRVLLAVPVWEDCLMLGLTDIRKYGGDSIWIVRAAATLRGSPAPTRTTDRPRGGSVGGVF